jgi:hypothetical protein
MRLIFFVLISIQALGQQVRLEYSTFFNDQKRGAPTVIFATSRYSLSAPGPSFPKEQMSYSNNSGQMTLFSTLENGQIISATDTLKYKYELLSDTKKVLGYTCKKAKTVVNSNTIEIWYTHELPYQVGPSPIGIDLGTVLETVRNGNTVVRATQIDTVDNVPALPSAMQYDLLTYRDLIWKSRFITLPVLDKELINWNEETKAKEGVIRFANGTLLVKKVKFPSISTDQQVFIELKQRSNGDAYDRTGSVFLIPETEGKNFFTGLEKGLDQIPSLKSKDGEVYQGMHITAEYLPNVELMRFFTSFGVHHYNYNKIKDKDWQDFTSFRQDISELRSIMNEKEVYIGTYIGNYDKGGHEVSLEITVHQGGSSYHRFNTAKPLFNTVNVLEMGGQNYATLFKDETGLQLEFTLEKDLKDAKLRYISTGHGGWGNGDEFLPKKNSIYLDAHLVHAFTPWRQDCGSYRLSNPVSGNFASGLSSSDLSRSNWCPATVTNPIYIDLGDLKAGKHSLRVKIPQGEREGSSFSFWNVSGVLLGNE